MHIVKPTQDLLYKFNKERVEIPDEITEFIRRRISRALWKLLPFEKRDNDEGYSLWPSAATKCPRQLALQVLGVPGEPLTARAKMTFFVGNLLEAVVLGLAQWAGVEVEPDVKREVKINDKPRRGAYDGIVKCVDGLRRLLEVKSISRYGYQEFLKYGPTDKFGYLGQGHVYLRQAVEDGDIDVPECVYVGINRDTNDMAEFILKWPCGDEGFFAGADYAVAADANFAEIEDALARHKLPKKGVRVNPLKPTEVITGETDEKGRLPLGCAYCGQKYSCWTKPIQIVDFNDKGEPVYSQEPETMIELKFERGRPVYEVFDIA